MPRMARVVLPDYPHHIIQRGHNRQPVFLNDEDYLYYLENIKEWKINLGCKVYAYCLMTNHIHLIVDPSDNIESLALLMKRISGRQTRYVNKLTNRRGTLWEGRYKSSPISTDEYLLACCRYVELNPVRAKTVSTPEEHRWSSYRHKVGIEKVDWLDLDPCYQGLGKSPKERETKYEGWMAKSIPESEWELIRQAVQRGQLTGGDSFIERVSKTIGQRVEFRGQGRPKRG